MLALIRRPGPRLAEGLVTHIERSSIDLDRALSQWERYVTALRTHGWKPIEVPYAPDLADSVFVEDTLLVYGTLAVIARTGAESRRAETADAERTVAALGYAIARIEAPGTLDGGDVLKVGSRVYVGQSGRTNAEGIAQLRSFLAPLGAEVIAVPMTRALHLKSAVTALPDGTVIGYAPIVDDPGVFPRFLAVPEEPGAHVLLLGNDRTDGRVLLSSAASQTAALLRSRGFEPVLVEIDEFEKLEGCVTCLSVRLRHPPVAPHGDRTP